MYQVKLCVATNYLRDIYLSIYQAFPFIITKMPIPTTFHHSFLLSHHYKLQNLLYYIWPSGTRTARTALAFWGATAATLVIGAPTVHLLLLRRSLGRRTVARRSSRKITGGREGGAPAGDDNHRYEHGLITPTAADLDDGTAAVLLRETVSSHAIPLRNLKPEFLFDGALQQQTNGSPPPLPITIHNIDKHDLVNAFLRTTMQSFTRMPHARLVRRMVLRSGDPEASASLEDSYLSDCAFRVGERVCGMYVVAERREEKKKKEEEEEGGDATVVVVILRLEPPVGWTGPVVRGLLGIGVILCEEGDEGDRGEEEGRQGGDGGEVRKRGEREGRVRFVSETAVWRTAEEKPSVLEGRVGGWLHELMVRWFVVKGVEAVTV